ncbi:MAG: ATP-dependent helicase [Bradyrhizobium sp.]
MKSQATQFQQLNESQRTAVEADQRPTLVLAGPGSGKTAVLVSRLARIIEQSPGEHFRVLGLTFTSRAAGEMEERSRELLSSGAERTLLTTFHSFAAETLRQHGSHIGVTPDFTILAQDADREAVLEKVIREAEVKRPDLDRGQVRLLPLIDNLLEKLVPLDEAAARIREPELSETVAYLYRGYRQALIEENSLDFSTLLCLACELLDQKPMVAKQLRSTYLHVLVDEFQDTSLAQFEFLKRLVGDDPSNLFVVADDDQIIYQWNGADPRRLKELEKRYAMRTIQLPTNYRCPPPVIELANALIAHNIERNYDKLPLTAAGTDFGADAVRVEEFPSSRHEAQWVASEIAKLPVQERDNCVVLARSTRLLKDVEPHFAAEGVESVLPVRKTDFESAPFRWLMSMLRLANGRGDRENLAVASRAFFKLVGIELPVEDLVASSSARGGDHLRSFIEEALARGSSLAPETRELLALDGRRLADKMDYQDFIDAAVSWFGSLETSAISSEERDFADFIQESEVWNVLTKAIGSRFGGTPIPLSTFLQELDLSPKVMPIPPGTVRCYTIHNAKGMEFPRVFLIGLAEDVLPSFQAIKKGGASDEMCEERRNCFVGITRTSESLVMTYAREYFGWHKTPSRFLYEMGVID